MANTGVLNLETVNLAGGPVGYSERVDDDRVENANFTAIDLQTGNVSASFYTKFFVSGTVQITDDVGASYARGNRVIKEVLCFAELSGTDTTGVSRLNVLRQEDGPGTAFVSIFSNNAFKPALSNSLGNYGIARAGTISGTLWKAGTILRAKFETAGLQKSATVCIIWVPSGSYGSAF